MTSSEYQRQWYQKNRERLLKLNRERAKEWRKNNPEKAKALDKKAREKHAKKRNTYSREWYEAHKDDRDFKDKRNERSLRHYYANEQKAKARSAVGKAVLKGKLNKPDKCESCNEMKPLEGHHADYSKPLDVTWLCKGCHEALHHQALTEVETIIKEMQLQSTKEDV